MLERAEVVVAGGGPGGICAALSAARLGKRTVLATNRPVLGGNSSSEIRVWTRGAGGGGGIYCEEMGIWGELKLRNLSLNKEGNPVFWDDVLLEQVLAEKNLILYLNTHIIDLKMREDSSILAVTGHQMGSEKVIRFEADYFIDATGDGTLGAMSGLPFRTGKESRTAFGETFAPASEEKTTFGSTIFFFTKKEDHPVVYTAPDFAYPMSYVEDLLGKGGRIVSEKMDGCDYWWFETGGMKDTIADAQEIGLELKRFVTGVWNYIKNSGLYDADCLTLDWEGNLPGKRESRRMITKKVLTQQDVLERPHFPDAAFYGGWYLDFHPSYGFQTSENNCTQVPVQPYAVPLGCLYHPSRPNLIFAGRDIGTSHVAFASTRIMNTCALCGQAAGTLAAACLTEKKVPDCLNDDEIREIQEQLLKDDMMIPGVGHQTDEDLAKEAEITVSSFEENGELLPDGWFDITAGSMLILPSEGRNAQFFFTARKDTELSYEISRFDLPSRLAPGTVAGSGSLRITAGEHWLSLPLPECDRDQFIRVEFNENPDVSLALAMAQLTGFLLGKQDSARYEYPCVRLAKPCGLYRKDNLTNGFSRPWQRPNGWLSDRSDEHPWIRITFPKPTRIQRIIFYFNPDLTMELGSSRAGSWDDHHKFEPRLAMPPELVKDAVLYCVPAAGNAAEPFTASDTAKAAPASDTAAPASHTAAAASSSAGPVLAALTDNWRRRWDIRLESPITVSELKLEIKSTYGAKRAEVFEVRVYEQLQLFKSSQN